MFYDSWVLNAFILCNVGLIVMTAVAYIYQSIQDRKSAHDGKDDSRTLPEA